MCKVSVIVPIYNSEKTLKKCLDSIITNNKDIEILLIDDGSTDNSEIVVNDYINNYPDIIKYYKKENTGVADTRNFGIYNATGKYIIFVDSDDYIDNKLFEEIDKYIEDDIDLIKFKMQRVDTKDKEIEKVDGPIFDKCTGEEAFNKLVFTDNLIDSPCIYVFKKSLFIDNNLKFIDKTEHEDFGLIPLLIVKAKTVVSISIYAYYYVQSEDSITRNIDYSKTLKKFTDTLIHYDNMIKFTKENEIADETKKNLKVYYTNSIILKLKTLSKDDRKKYVKIVKQKGMIDNIKTNNLKQVIKKWILQINIDLYLKLK